VFQALYRRKVLLVCAAAVCATPFWSVAQHSAAPNTSGKKIFATNCSGCHGLDGKGSDRAPDIAQRREIQKLSDAELIRVVQEGVSGTGMPAFHSLPTADLRAVVGYVRSLQGVNKPLSFPGDPKKGEISFEQAGCAGCHMVAGKGGFIASDLSSYAHTHNVQEIRGAIGHSNPAQARSVVVRMKDGQAYSGRIRNEDNFSVQLQTLDGHFHFLSKADVEKIENATQSVVPTDYATRLSTKELNDIVSYLMRAASLRKPDVKKEYED